MNKYEAALLKADDIPISESIDCYDVFCYIERLKYEKKQAVREFAEKLKERVHGYENISWDTDKCLCEDIDKLLAEVTGE